jgi:hypothetical protein
LYLYPILSLVARDLNEQSITWGLGGSLMLVQHGIVDQANDIDLLLLESDAARSHAILQKKGASRRGEAKDPFRTIHFYQYDISEAKVEAISGLRISHKQGVYEHIFDAASISGHLLIDKARVPLTSLEDWFVLYQMIPFKEDKANLIEAHFEKYGITRPDLLRRALDGVLPDQVYERIEKLLIRLT